MMRNVIALSVITVVGASFGSPVEARQLPGRITDRLVRHATSLSGSSISYRLIVLVTKRLESVCRV